MTGDQWEQFFDLLRQVVNGNEPWTDKRDMVISQARQNGALTELAELAAWIESEV